MNPASIRIRALQKEMKFRQDLIKILPKLYGTNHGNAKALSVWVLDSNQR